MASWGIPDKYKNPTPTSTPTPPTPRSAPATSAPQQSQTPQEYRWDTFVSTGAPVTPEAWQAWQARHPIDGSNTTQAPRAVSRRTSRGYISQGYGSQHPGIDIAAPYGSAIRSPVHGRVTSVTSLRNANGYYSYGNYIVVTDRHGRQHRFAHLSGFNVRQGQLIGPGALLGTVGSTGNSTGNHLHYEVRDDGGSIDPSRWTPNLGSVIAVAAPAYSGSSSGSSVSGSSMAPMQQMTISGVEMSFGMSPFDLPATSSLIQTKDRITPMFVRALTDTSKEAAQVRKMLQDAENIEPLEKSDV